MSKKETLEEYKAALIKFPEYDRFLERIGFEEGTKWQQERSYSEEEVNKMFDTLKRNSIDNVAIIHNVDLFISSWKQEFKKK